MAWDADGISKLISSVTGGIADIKNANWQDRLDRAYKQQQLADMAGYNPDGSAVATASGKAAISAPWLLGLGLLAVVLVLKK